MQEAYVAAVRALYAAIGDVEQWPNACLAAEDRAREETAIKTHLEIAAALHDRLLSVSRAHALCAGALEVMPFALIIVDPSGRPLFVHRCAHAVFADGDGITLAPSGLVVGGVAAREAVRQGIASAIERRQRTSVVVPRHSGRPGYVLAIAPIDLHARLTGGVAAIIISDPDANPELDQAALRSAYGLTRAEAALVSILVRGRTLEEAADVLCVSLSTVKTHLQRVFLKTDTDRQAELVRRLLLGHLRLG
jgi:DNA-binding CsgD family transcriptional regulator